MRLNMLSCGLILTAALVTGCASAPDELTASAQAPRSPDAIVEAETTEVTLEEITLDPGSVVVCRDMLKQGSNVITTTCMSRNDWKRYERFRAEEAAAIVRTLQGGAYR